MMLLLVKNALPSQLLGQGDRDGLAGAALGDPESVARRFDASWCLESFLDHRDAGFVSMDRDRGNFTAAIFGHEELAVRRAHAIGSLDRLVQRNIDRLPRLPRWVDRNAIE